MSNRKNTGETIRVKRVPSSFVQMHKGFLEDPVLSYKAKGILAYLLTKPDGWIVRVKDIMNHGREGRDAIYGGLAELEKQGYYKKERMRNDKGQVFWESIVCEVSMKDDISPQKPVTENPELVTNPEKPDLQPLPEKPYTAYPHTGKPYTENTELSNNYITNIDYSNNELNIKNIPSPAGEDVSVTEERHACIGDKLLGYGQQSLDPSFTGYGKTNQQGESLTVQTAQGTGITMPVDHSKTPAEQTPTEKPATKKNKTVRKPQDKQLWDMFDRFWELYPRKVDKTASEKSWYGIKPDETLFRQIITGIELAVRWWETNETANRHIPYPSTWLNKKRWLDADGIRDELSQSTTAIGSAIHRYTGNYQNLSTVAGYQIGGENDPYKNIVGAGQARLGG